MLKDYVFITMFIHIRLNCILDILKIKKDSFLLIDNIKDIYIFFYVLTVYQLITHLINVITINILIIHSNKSWKVNVQQWYTLLNDKMLINHVYFNIKIHINLYFYLLIFLNYILFIYKSFYKNNFLFYSW